MVAAGVFPGTHTTLRRGGDVTTAALPALSVQFADYAAWQRRWLTGERLARHRAYWTEQLTALPPALELPADRPRPARPSGREARTASRSPRTWWPACGNWREEGTSLFTLLLAAYQVWLHRYTGQEDLIVGPRSRTGTAWNCSRCWASS